MCVCTNCIFLEVEREKEKERERAIDFAIATAILSFFFCFGNFLFHFSCSIISNQSIYEICICGPVAKGWGDGFLRGGWL